MKKKVKAIVRTVLIVLVALIIGLNIYALNASRLAGNLVPMPFGVGMAVVLSGSMEPTLSVGDLLIVAERDEYRIGDVVVYQADGMAITHRIVDVTGDGIITRGDANNTDDSPLNPNQIKGEVVCAIPLIGHVVNLIKTPVGTLCIIGLAVFLLDRSFRVEKQKSREALDVIKAEIEKLKQEQNQNS